MSLVEDALEEVGKIATTYGVPLLAKWFAGNVPQDQAHALLDAEYAAARAAADALAVKIVDGE